MWKKFWDFLKTNTIYLLIAMGIFWSPLIVIGILSITITPWLLTLETTLIAIWVTLPAIPIQLGLALAIKYIWKLIFRRKK